MGTSFQPDFSAYILHKADSLDFYVQLMGRFGFRHVQTRCLPRDNARSHHIMLKQSGES